MVFDVYKIKNCEVVFENNIPCLIFNLQSSKGNENTFTYRDKDMLWLGCLSKYNNCNKIN
jgi:hypothetical protein